MIKSWANFSLIRWSAGLIISAAVPAVSVAHVAVAPQTVIDDHLQSLATVPHQRLKAESRVKLLEWKTLSGINCDCELLGELGNPRVEKLYRLVLADSLFLIPRIPSPTPELGVSRFQISCRNVVAQGKKFLGDSICWEDDKSLTGLKLPPSQHRLTMGFIFSGKKLVSVRVHSTAPNFKAAIASFQATQK